MIKSYNDMIEEVSSSSRKDLQYIYDSTYSFATEDIVSANIYQLTPKQVIHISIFLLFTDEISVYFHACVIFTNSKIILKYK
jgi:hypothetical protein